MFLYSKRIRKLQSDSWVYHAYHSLVVFSLQAYSADRLYVYSVDVYFLFCCQVRRPSSSTWLSPTETSRASRWPGRDLSTLEVALTSLTPLSVLVVIARSSSCRDSRVFVLRRELDLSLNSVLWFLISGWFGFVLISVTVNLVTEYFCMFYVETIFHSCVRIKAHDCRGLLFDSCEKTHAAVILLLFIYLFIYHVNRTKVREKMKKCRKKHPKTQRETEKNKQAKENIQKHRTKNTSHWCIIHCVPKTSTFSFFK